MSDIRTNLIAQIKNASPAQLQGQGVPKKVQLQGGAASLQPPLNPLFQQQPTQTAPTQGIGAPTQQLTISGQPTLPLAFRRAAQIRTGKEPQTVLNKPLKTLQTPLSTQERSLLARENRRRLQYQQAQANVREAVFGLGRNVFQSTGNWLTGIPIPGGVIVPLLVLIIVWSALIPVNGHTRLDWLWKVVTNNAYIGVNPVQSSNNQTIAGPGGIQGSGSTFTEQLQTGFIPYTPYYDTGIEGL